MPDIITAPPAAQAPAATPTNTTPTPGTKAPVKLEVVGGKEPQAIKPTPPSGAKEGEVTKEADPVDPAKPFVIKVDGKEHHLSKEEVIKLAQKGVGADRKFNQAHQIKTQAEQFIRLLKTDPMKILNHPDIGLDMKKIAQEIIAKDIEMEVMTPEQRELYDLKAKLKAAEDEKKDTQETEHQARFKQLVEHYSGELEKDITTTLQSSGLPKTRSTVKRIAYYMQRGLAQGVELKSADVIDLVREDYQREHNELYGAADGDTLLKMFGDPIIQKILEANLKKVQGGGQLPPTLHSEPATPPAPSTKMSREEWREMMKNKK